MRSDFLSFAHVVAAWTLGSLALATACTTSTSSQPTPRAATSAPIQPVVIPTAVPTSTSTGTATGAKKGQPQKGSTPTGATPKYNAPGGTSIDEGPLALDGSSNEVNDSLGQDTDNSGFSLTATYELTLTAPTSIILTDIVPNVSDDFDNSCTYQSFVVLVNAAGSTVATVPISSAVTPDEILEIPGTQAAGSYKLAIVLQSPSACSVDFFFDATQSASAAASTGTSSSSGH